MFDIDWCLLNWINWGLVLFFKLKRWWFFNFGYFFIFVFVDIDWSNWVWEKDFEGWVVGINCF